MYWTGFDILTESLTVNLKCTVMASFPSPNMVNAKQYKG